MKPNSEKEQEWIFLNLYLQWGENWKKKRVLLKYLKDIFENSPNAFHIRDNTIAEETI